MKRKITKILSLMLVLALAMSLIACGSSKKTSEKKNDDNKSQLAELSAEELVNKLASSTEEMQGVSAKANLDLAVSASGTEMISMSGSVDMKSVLDPMKAYAKVDLNLNAMGQEQSQTMETYEVADGNVLEMYSLTDGEWSYTTQDLSDVGMDLTQITDELAKIDFSTVSEYFDSIESKKIGGNYQLEMKITTAKLLEKAKELGLSEYLGEEVDLSTIPDATIVITLVCDGETYLPSALSVSLDMDPITYQGVEIDVTKFVFDITFDSYENIEITVPDEALAAK